MRGWNVWLDAELGTRLDALRHIQPALTGWMVDCTPYHTLLITITSQPAWPQSSYSAW
jgi:hypothetical protein